MVVAVKKLKPNAVCASESDLHDFINESKLLRKLHHK
jgi:hypothetical protein